MNITSADFTPLLVGKVKIGLITNVQRHFIIEELLFRGVIVERKEKITKLKSLLVEHENPKIKCELTKKLFFPKLSTTIILTYYYYYTKKENYLHHCNYEILKTIGLPSPPQISGHIISLFQ